MQSSGRPDFVVAVDFGMTCCGVAYSSLTSRSDQIFFIQKWPGRAQASENKVPTSIVYTKNDRRPIAWGFASDAAYDQRPAETEYKEWFKTLLDPVELQRDQQQDPNGAPQSMEEVEALYEDFLRLLYGHIEVQLNGQLYGKTWPEAKVEFIFSLPTTWTDKSIVEKFRSIILRAGYTRYPRHSVDIGLTEAEAAAVQVSKRDQGVFRVGDVIMVCDAGGGTTDLSIQRVEGCSNDILSLQQLDVVQGRNIGSASIDADFERLARTTLENARDAVPFDLSDEQIHELSWSMMKSSEYQSMKCEFGSKITQYFNTFTVAAKGLPLDYRNEEFMISDQTVKFHRKDFQALFDSQLAKLFNLIDIQLADLERKLPEQTITHLVLSGGLGNSPYVLEQLKARFEMGGTTRFRSTEWLQVRVAPEPQLAVCKGIVEDRIQKLSAGQAVMGWRCCRESYGVAYKELYDANNPHHAGRQTAVDEADAKLYVVDGIDWFIKAGDPVSTDKAIVHNFFRTISEYDTVRRFNTNVYVSRSQTPQSLPNYIAPGSDIYRLCEIESDLSSFGVENFEQKGRQPWSRNKPHYRVRYEIKFVVGPGDLRIELWFNGCKVNIDQAIRVEWFPAPQFDQVLPKPASPAQIPSPVGSQREASVSSSNRPVHSEYRPPGSLSPDPQQMQQWYSPAHSPSELESFTPLTQPSPQLHSPHLNINQQTQPVAQHSLSPSLQAASHSISQPSIPTISAQPLAQSLAHTPISQPQAQSPSSSATTPIFYPPPQQNRHYSSHPPHNQAPVQMPSPPPVVSVIPHMPVNQPQASYPSPSQPVQQPNPQAYQGYPFPQQSGAIQSFAQPPNSNLQPPSASNPYSNQTSTPPAKSQRMSSTSFGANFKSEFQSLKAGFASSRGKPSTQDNPPPPSSANVNSAAYTSEGQIYVPQPYQPQYPQPQQHVEQPQPYQPPDLQRLSLQPQPQTQAYQTPAFQQQSVQPQPQPHQSPVQQPSPQFYQPQYPPQQQYQPQAQSQPQQRAVSGSNFAGNFKSEFDSLKRGFSSFKQRKSAPGQSWG